jgi:hypothetical protein
MDSSPPFDRSGGIPASGPLNLAESGGLPWQAPNPSQRLLTVLLAKPALTGARGVELLLPPRCTQRLTGAMHDAAQEVVLRLDELLRHLKRGVNDLLSL